MQVKDSCIFSSLCLATDQVTRRESRTYLQITNDILYTPYRLASAMAGHSSLPVFAYPRYPPPCVEHYLVNLAYLPTSGSFCPTDTSILSYSSLGRLRHSPVLVQPAPSTHLHTHLHAFSLHHSRVLLYDSPTITHFSAGVGLHSITRVESLRNHQASNNVAASPSV